jgi:DNA-binding GntR family transcriptional regulator
MRTSYRFLADGAPVMLSTSFEPLAITGGTPVEQPEGGPVTGVIPRMDSIGVHITHVSEDVTGRAARPYEAETLVVPPGVPVLVIERTYYDHDRPVETADIIVSSDRYVLSYRLAIPER